MGKEGPGGAYGVKGTAGWIFVILNKSLYDAFCFVFQDYRVHLVVMVFLAVC